MESGHCQSGDVAFPLKLGEPLFQCAARNAVDQSLDCFFDAGFGLGKLPRQFPSADAGRVAELAPSAVEFAHVLCDHIGRP